jgi:hypothetical protein
MVGLVCCPMAACGHGTPPDPGAVLAVARQAQAALIAGDGEKSCSLLTPRARSRALGFRVDFDDGGAIPSNSPRLPQTCREIVSREWKRAREGLPDSIWLLDLRIARFVVKTIDSHRATVLLTSRRGARVTLTFVATNVGWRIDDSDAVPFGH